MNKVNELIPIISSLDTQDQRSLLIWLTKKICENNERLECKYHRKNACIRAALKINKNEAVANLLDDNDV